MNHANECPLHEDNPEPQHDCKRSKHVAIEWNAGWYLVRLTSRIYIRISFCPFCGDELPFIKCECADISEGLKERNLELRTGRGL